MSRFYPADLEPLLQGLLATLADMETEREIEARKLTANDLPDRLKQCLVPTQEAQSEERCAPYRVEIECAECDSTRGGASSSRSVFDMPTSYRLIRLAPGSYDIEYRGWIVASLVRGADRRDRSVPCYAELLEEAGPRPAPFTQAVHEFISFDAAVAWLGNPDVALPRVA